MCASAQLSRFDPRRIFAALLEMPIYRELRAMLDRRPCHIVGGALRDVALGLEPRDIDVVIAGRGRELAQELAAELGYRQVRLGGDRFASYRLVGPEHTIDLWDRQNRSLQEDLLRRDLTIHSFALDLSSLEITDPCNGLADLRLRCLRATTPRSFTDDPLRVLRLCRFATRMATFRIENHTQRWAAAAAPRIQRTAAQRVRTELEAILTSPFAARSAELLVELTVYPALWSAHQVDQGPCATDLSRSFDILEAAAGWLPQSVDFYCARMALLFAFLPEASSVGAIPALTAFRSSGWITKKNAQRVARICESQPLPSREADRRWFLHRLSDLWPSAVAFLVARHQRAEDPSSIRTKVRDIASLALHHDKEIFAPPPLISGDDLLKDLGIEPGARIGGILAAVRRQQIEGAIHSRQQALALARHLARTVDPRK